MIAVPRKYVHVFTICGAGPSGPALPKTPINHSFWDGPEFDPKRGRINREIFPGKSKLLSRKICQFEEKDEIFIKICSFIV